MNIEVGQTYSFKLNSGEELVAKLLKIDEGIYIISDPVSIGPNPNGGLGLVPSMFTVNMHSNVRLNTNSVALVAETDDSVKMKYLEATTGIKVPDKKVILG
jgi:hypothetical protein